MLVHRQLGSVHLNFILFAWVLSLLGVMQPVSQSVNLKATWLSLQGISNLSSYIGFLAIPNFKIEEKKRVV